MFWGEEEKKKFQILNSLRVCFDVRVDADADVCSIRGDLLFPIPVFSSEARIVLGVLWLLLLPCLCWYTTIKCMRASSAVFFMLIAFLTLRLGS